MKKFLQILVLILAFNANAQIGGGWDWAFNTGTLGGAEMKHMKYTADGSEILFGGSALAAAYFGSTTLTAPPPLANRPGQIKFFGKINSATGVPTIVRSFSNLPITFDCITTDDAGNFYTGGFISSTTPVDLGNGISADGFRQVAIIKFSPTGNTIWAKVIPFGGTGTAANNVLQLAAAPSGNVFFTGFSGNVDANGKRNNPLYKLDNNGNILWFKNALNASNAVGNVYKNFVFSDKFIDNNENVHVAVNTFGAYTFDGISYLGGDPTYGSATLISLNAAGSITNTKASKGSFSNFQVNRTTGNFTFKWEQGQLNTAPFNNLPHVLANFNPAYANYFNGMIETDSNFNFIRAKDFSTTVDNPIDMSDNDNIFLALPNGKLLIQTEFQKTAPYFAGVDYGYPADPNKNAVAIVETDANWNISKFIAGGKTTLPRLNYLTAFNNTYCMGAGFSNYDIFNQSLPATNPTTSYGTINLTGFNAASDFTTAYSAVVTSTSERADIAIVQTKSENFPTIGATTWLGNTNNWNTPSNWSNGVPTILMKALFNAPTTNYPTLSTTPTAASLQINTGVNLTLPTTLVLTSGIKNDGNITINNAGIFQGFGSNEWRGNGTVTYIGTASSHMYNKTFTNSLILNTNIFAGNDLRIPKITLNNAKLNLNSKKLIITDPNPAAITTASTSSYVYGGALQRNTNATGMYEFPMGTFSNAQSVVINANNLQGTGSVTATFTEGAITGTIPNTTYNGVAITSTLNGGWFSVNPNQQPTSGSYDVTLKIQNSTNTLASVGNYTVIKRDNSTSPWAALGNYNLGATSAGIVTVTNSNLTSFSDFAIGRGVSDITLSGQEFLKSNLKIFPNPATSQINLSFENNLENANIKIISLIGQTVFEKQNLSGNNLSFDVSNLAKGVYVVTIDNGGLVSNSKFIKE